METFHNRLQQAMQQKHMTQSDLCAKTGISRSTMSQYCSGSFRPKESKLRLLAKALGVKEAWLLGYDSPEEPPVSWEDYPNLRPIQLKRFPLLGEIACGDSMIGARIYDGDAVFIRNQPMVENGEIAAVIIDDEATLKRVYYDREHARLQLVPENPAYSPLVYVGEELDNIRILGKAVGFMSIF